MTITDNIVEKTFDNFIFEKICDIIPEKFYDSFVFLVISLFAILYICGNWFLSYGISIISTYFWNNGNPVFAIIIGVIALIVGLHAFIVTINIFR